MKKVLQCIGSLVYSSILGFLLAALFAFLTPIIMRFKVIGFLLYLFLGGSALFGLAQPLMTLLSIPCFFLVKGNLVAKILGTLPFLWYGFFTIILPWTEPNLHYGLLQWLLAISLSVMIFMAYVSQILILFKAEDFAE